MSNAQSNPTLADCTFEQNSTEGSGGGIVNQSGKPILLRCTFRANVAAKDGGAVYSHNGCQLAVFNCLFVENAATIGGGMQSGGGSGAYLTNCTFTGNLAETGGALSGFSDARTTLVNCILWGDKPSEIGGSNTIATCSNVQGGWPGEGNIDADPLLTDPNSGCHLKSRTGRWDPAIRGWAIDPVSSPCIDAGDPDDGIGLEPFPNGNRINMGAYGGTLEASLSLSQPAPTPPGKALNPVPADGAINVGTYVVLRWTAGPRAVAHDVYFGTTVEEVADSSRDNPSTLVSMGQSGTTYNPGILDSGQRYCWRIDELDDRGNVTKGDVWVFKTVVPSATAGKASLPIPADGASNVSTNVVLSWTPGLGAVAHDVYLGTDSDAVASSSRDNPGDVLVSMGQSAATYDPPGNLGSGQAYYWRVDEIDSENQITQGDVWTFKVGAAMRR
jgi:predicted outer membrane repeat protein